ncbi:MAG: hypothetical protein HFH94_03080 [Lachnospiraceae bacterium]|nr:hypothetical protein [Lachnospiraceae bacterium]
MRVLKVKIPQDSVFASGLDYTKVVIVRDNDYLDSAKAADQPMEQL